jgi:hypothetical protein
MTVARGWRAAGPLREVYDRLVGAGFVANAPAPTTAGGTYVQDGLGTTVELLVAPRELDPGFGFAPQPLFRRQPSWPQPSVGPATQ